MKAVSESFVTLLFLGPAQTHINTITLHLFFLYFANLTADYLFWILKSKTTMNILLDSPIQEIMSSDDGVEYIPNYIMTIKALFWVRGLDWELEINDIYRLFRILCHMILCLNFFSKQSSSTNNFAFIFWLTLVWYNMIS